MIMLESSGAVRRPEQGEQSDQVVGYGASDEVGSDCVRPCGCVKDP